MKRKPTLMSVLLELHPTSSFVMRGETWEDLEWLDQTERLPKEVVQAEFDKQLAEWERLEYSRQRAEAYPSIEEQLDVLYHEGYDGWKSLVDEIKSKYPKPE